MLAVRVIQGFAFVPERITRDKEISDVSCGVGPENVGFNYPMMCKAIERLSQGVKDGNGDEYAKDLLRLVHVTSRSSIYPEMRELVMDAFDGDKQEFVRPKPSLINLFREWDSISDFIRAGGVGDLLIGGLSYRMDDFRLMVSLINCGVYKGDENFNAESGLPAKSELCYPEIHSRNLMLLVDRFDDQSPDLKAKVDRSALAGKNVGGCVKVKGEADKRASTCDNKIVDNSKGKLFKGDENFSSFGGFPAKSELCYPEIHPRNLKLLVDRFDDQSPDLKAKVDRSALAGKNVGGCVNGNGEVDKRANTCGNKIVDHSKGKLTNVESSGTAANKWNKKGSTSASMGAWNTPAEEETWGSVGEVSSRETGYSARNCSLGADCTKVDRSALAGKIVGGCVKGKGEADKIVDNSKGKLTNVESSGTAGNKWNKKGSTSASKGTWNTSAEEETYTSAEEETWGSVGEVSSRETGYFARNCSLGAVGSKWSRQWKYWKGT